ncbi:MAG: hypothetical protein AB4352_04865 [Hormoscilla sp.]
MPRITIDSQENCVEVSTEWMDNLQKIAAAATLEPGTYVLRLNSGNFSYGPDDKGEPFVLLWIYGGKFTDLQTGNETIATWESLNGYSDTVTLEVKETVTVNALFIDTNKSDNTGQVSLSILPDNES